MTTPYLEKIKINVRAKIKNLSADVMIQTNEGTFGAEECCRVTGSGDPIHGNYRIYETLAGEKRTVGCDPKNAPGYARRNTTRLSPAKRRAEIKRLHALIAKIDNWPSHEPLSHDITAFEFSE